MVKMKKQLIPFHLLMSLKSFSVKITDVELAGLVKDSNGDIQFSKVMEFFLPRFDQDHVDNGAFGPERPPLKCHSWSPKDIQALCHGLQRQN